MLPFFNDYSRMSALYSKSGISKPPRAKPTAIASNYLTDLKARIGYITPKEESDIRSRFFNWINENRKLEIRKSAEEKKNKFFEIAEKILNLSRSQEIFENLSDLEPEKHVFSEDFSNIPWNIPEDFRFEWMIEKPAPKKVQIQSPAQVQTSLPEPSLSRTLRRIFFTDLIIKNYLYGSF
jgi:hypothetical protein